MFRQKTPLLASNIKIDYLAKAYQSQVTGILKYAFASTALGSLKAFSLLKNKIQGKKPVIENFPKDTVIIYQFPRALNSPSLSPFCLKLETWCRAANINYQNKLGMKVSSRGTVPFIRLNDFVIEDSEKCIEYLSKVFQINLNSELSEEQKAIARSVQALVEESLKWPMVLHRFWYSPIPKQENGLPLLAIWYFSYRMFRAAWYSGAARYTKQEIYEKGKRDLSALDSLIGSKKFLLSDTKPCDVDFAIFGLCAQLKYNDRGPLNQHLLANCHNVNRHVETIKGLYWKDWDQNTLANKISRKKSFPKKFLSLFKKV